MFFSFCGRAAAAVTIITLVAGCGGMQQPLGSHSTDHTFALGAKSAQRLLYISTTADQTTHGLILVYPAGLHQHNAQLIRKFYADRPEGLAVDRSGVLYVINTFNNGPCSIAEYRPGASSPFRTITSGLGDARTAAVDKDGTVYVNERDLHIFKDVVVVYGPGATKPTRRIVLPLNAYDLGPVGITLDSAGNLFVAVFVPQSGTLHVFHVPAGSSHPTDLQLQGIPGGGSGASGVAVDPQGNLFVGGVGGIGVYAPGANTPFRQISSGGGLFAIDNTNGNLYSGNDEFAPGGDTPVNSVQLPFNTNTIGDAVGPS